MSPTHAQAASTIKLPLSLGIGVLVAAMVGCGACAAAEIHLIPKGYSGNIFILHGVLDGEPLEEEGLARVYRIPPSGVLRSQTSENQGVGRPEYFFISPDGSRDRITALWASTIHDTPENTADPTIGIFFPRSGTQWSREQPCEVHFEEYFVGTKAQLLATKTADQGMLDHYLREHPVCPPGKGSVLPPGWSHKPP
jgi:hypothetical protein